MAIRYHIRRREMLKALGLPATIPVGQTGEWFNVKVMTDYHYEGCLDAAFIILPRVWLRPSGVANRIQVECPLCGQIIRFSVLQQHADSKACQKNYASGKYTSH